MRIHIDGRDGDWHVMGCLVHSSRLGRYKGTGLLNRLVLLLLLLLLLEALYVLDVHPWVDVLYQRTSWNTSWCGIARIVRVRWSVSMRQTVRAFRNG